MGQKRRKGPLYLQIKEALKDRILHGVYPLGKNIPSEPQLEKEFGVSKITVRNAVKELVQEGYVEKASGRGTTVISNTSGSRLSKGKRFTQWLVDEGHRLEKKMLRVDQVRLPVTHPLAQAGRSDCLRCQRLYLLDGQPYIHYTHDVSLHLQGEALVELQQNMTSLYRFLNEYGLRLDEFRDEFSVDIAPEEVLQAMKLEQKDAMLMKRTRFASDEQGELVEYSIGYYNTQLKPYVVSYEESGA
ncbi:GntR family transcriptional regulator [Bacillaceae bacterium SIJ1]|uniref:GntR family transcriptional regulator n=1 Tax=Litoribacterium kuwaitense TaxID=1398745 RepID=UPI0013EC9CCA|nr:GntR family transcriptional regulator [Litoribacterium kuwaitense]NGP46904.1 GntR family transcriptional regulator [Litoribacterium kuwaitense]